MVTDMLRTLIVCVLLLSGASAAAQTVINLEEAAEVEKLEILLNGTSQGVVYAGVCDYCKRLRLTLDANTDIRRQRRALTLEQAAAVRDAGATVLFDPSTNRVTRIKFWN